MLKERGSIRFAKVGCVCVALVLFAAAFACEGDRDREVRQLTGGDPERGRGAIQAHGCTTCHTVPGVSGSDGLVGPPLDRIGSRVYLAGRIPNTPENMMRWIRFPKDVDPQTVMPQMQISEEEARDIAAYLYTLR